jgi:hypothetical protein
MGADAQVADLADGFWWICWFFVGACKTGCDWMLCSQNSIVSVFQPAHLASRFIEINWQFQLFNAGALVNIRLLFACLHPSALGCRNASSPSSAAGVGPLRSISAAIPSLTRGRPILSTDVLCNVCGPKRAYRPSEIFIGTGDLAKQLMMNEDISKIQELVEKKTK